MTGPDAETAVPHAGALLTVTGADRPGVTARLFAALAGVPALEVVDVEQVVVHGQLVLGSSSTSTAAPPTATWSPG